METTTERKRKSEALTQSEREKFETYAKSFSTKLDCMEALDMSMPTLDRIRLK